MASSFITFKKKILALQEYSLMLKDLFLSIKSINKCKRDAINEMYLVGSQAFLLVLLGGAFVGIILALETGYQLDLFGAKNFSWQNRFPRYG